MRKEVQLIAESFYGTKTMSRTRAEELAGLAVAVLDKAELHLRHVHTNPATRIQIEQWSRA